MMITWFINYSDYNFLFLNSRYDDVMHKIITTECKSELYNIIGISYGAAIAIYLSNKIRTGAVVSIYPIPIDLDFDLDNIFQNNNSIFFFHHSSEKNDNEIHKNIMSCIQKTNLMYMVMCSQYPVHSTYIPNNNRILNI